MTIKPTDQAFPSHWNRDTDEPKGMDLRTYLAGQAMNGIVSAYSGDVPLPDHDDAAKWAVSFADALIARLNEEDDPP